MKPLVANFQEISSQVGLEAFGPLFQMSVSFSTDRNNRNHCREESERVETDG